MPDVVPTPTLSESIAMFEVSRSVKPWDHMKQEVVQPMVDAAGLVVLLKEDCQTCDGTGSMPLPKSGHLSTAAYVCSVCAGRGWNPTAQAIEWLVPLMVEMEPRYSGSYAAPREAARKVIIRLLSMGDTNK